MSDSYRKTPITGWTRAASEKEWKQRMNRRRRLAEKAALKDLSSTMPDPTKGEFGPKDGRMWIGDEWPEYMRK